MFTVKVKSALSGLYLSLGFLVFSVSAQTTLTKLNSIEFLDERCFLTWTLTDRIIKDKASLKTLIRKDRSGDACSKKFSVFDFEKNSLLGVTLNTGYCRRPLMLQHEVFSDAAQKLYIVNVIYPEPAGVCRALSRYDLWLTVPRIPDGFQVRFDVKPLPREQN